LCVATSPELEWKSFADSFIENFNPSPPSFLMCPVGISMQIIENALLVGLTNVFIFAKNDDWKI
jgi:hypothetical protein